MLIGGKTLKEIANMPYIESIKFMRKHHDKDWGKQELDEDGNIKGLRKFKARVEWREVSYNYGTFEVEAYTTDSAKDKFWDMAREQGFACDDIEDVEIQILEEEKC